MEWNFFRCKLYLWTKILYIKLVPERFPHNYYFFKAEDGIRNYRLTGVQTCALPISSVMSGDARRTTTPSCRTSSGSSGSATRSEERRVGEEWRSRWSPYHLKKKQNAQGRTRPPFPLPFKCATTSAEYL